MSVRLNGNSAECYWTDLHLLVMKALIDAGVHMEFWRHVAQELVLK